MKKIVLLFISLLLITGCNKKEIIENDKMLGLDSLIKYELPNYYEKGGEYFSTTDDTIKIEEDYYSTKDEGYFQVKIFSYKNQDIFSEEKLNINLQDYIDSLNHMQIINIDNNKIYVGYTESEEVEDVLVRAYVSHKDYVIEFMMNNSDDVITEEQYNDFITIIKTVKFK